MNNALKILKLRFPIYVTHRRIIVICEFTSKRINPERNRILIRCTRIKRIEVFDKFITANGGRKFPIVNGTSFHNNVQRIATVNHYQLSN